MQMQDSYTVVRRALDFEDYLDILRRHKSWIIGPLYAGIVIATVVAFLWPDTYVSSAMIRVTPSQVPERFVPTALNQMLTERINSIAQGVLSRTTLINIIQTYDLYPRDRRRLPMEDVVEKMRSKDIAIGMVSSLQGQSARAGAFPIQFKYEDRYLAQKVAQELVSRLITENARVQQGLTRSTSEFMDEQVEATKKRLDEIEGTLTGFRLKNRGLMPEERSMQLSTLQALQNRIETVTGGINRVTQDKLILESQLRIQKEQLSQLMASATAVTNSTASRVQNERLVSLEREIQTTEQQLAQLREMYRETWPDVQRTKTNLEQLRKQRDVLAKREEDAQKAAAAAAASAKPASKPVVMTREMQELQGSVKQLETLIQAKSNEAQEYNSELSKLNGQVREFQGRLGATPIADAEYSKLARDYDIVKMEYQNLLLKQSDAQRGAEVERRNQGETLELLDAASLPVEPTEPKRVVIVGAGAALGFVAGLFLVGVREMKDTTLKNLKDVRAYTNLTVLGSVPLLEEDIVVKRRKRLTLLAWCTAVLVGVLVMGGSFYYYIVTKP